MKFTAPVTIYDLECTAKDDKNGITEYCGVKVYWDDATDTFSYYCNGVAVSKVNAEAVLELKR